MRSGAPRGKTDKVVCEGMKKYFAPVGLISCVVISLVMWILKPIPNGYHYEYAFMLSVDLTAIWLLYRASPRTFFKPAVLAFIMLCGLGLGFTNLSAVKPKAEIVRYYQTVFDALENGKNPYTAGTIFHITESNRPVAGNFNYPPLEIYPYYLASRIAGTWNITVLTITILLLQAFCCLVLVLMFPRIRLIYLLPFFPILLMGEVKTGPAMTLLLTALTVLAIKKNREKPRRILRYLIAVLFGLGLMTKFLVIPLMAAYYWHKFDAKRLRSLIDIAVDVSIALATAVLVMAPFGVANVFKNTILFNLVLKDRAVLATFFPNVLSGPLTWLGLQGLYAIAAIAILAMAILAAPKLNLFAAMLTAAYVFLFVAATPEPQFVPLLLFLVLAVRCMAVEERGVFPQVLKQPPTFVMGMAS